MSSINAGKRKDECFNEAGAINPGKHSALKGMFPMVMKRFNEAGAINPGKQKLLETGKVDWKGFNEAGAINPGKP